jgi:acid phosphatase family membrane protein YuiD
MLAGDPSVIWQKINEPGCHLQNHVLWSGMAGWFLAGAKSRLTVCVNAAGIGLCSLPPVVCPVRIHAGHVHATAVGLHYGFDNPLFGVAVAVAMVVVYDATGVRRQAGMQAQKINVLVAELLKGHPINEQQLREVLGHTPLEAIGGVILGLLLAIGLWFWWR